MGEWVSGCMSGWADGWMGATIGWRSGGWAPHASRLTPHLEHRICLEPLAEHLNGTVAQSVVLKVELKQRCMHEHPRNGWHALQVHLVSGVGWEVGGGWGRGGWWLKVHLVSAQIEPAQKAWVLLQRLGQPHQLIRVDPIRSEVERNCAALKLITNGRREYLAVVRSHGAVSEFSATLGSI